MIDQELLDSLSDTAYGVRAAIAPELSNVYVPGEGNNPQVMIIGEAPGAQEEIARRPFVGAAGRVLRQLMTFAGLYTGETPHFGEGNCWITNVVKFRPPRNRTPYYIETMGFRQLLRQEWEVIGKPLIIVPVGSTALLAVKGKQLSILRMSGIPIPHVTQDNDAMTIYPMIHPSYGLRNKSVTPVIERDWERFGKWLRS